MLRLILFRHAKASWGEPALTDEKRPLTVRGCAEAEAMGRQLAQRGLVPDVVLCSHARRARQTLELAAPHWLPQPNIRTTPELYGAINDTYLDAIRSLGEGRCLMLVGHNPAMEESARLLAGQAEGQLISRLMLGFPTGAAAIVDFAVAAWRDVTPKSGTLAAFLEPH